MSDGMLKCRWCEYQTRLWTRRKGGKPKPSGYDRLRAHAEDYHGPEIDALDAKLDSFDMLVALSGQDPTP